MLKLNTPLTIEEFSTLLEKEQDDDSLLAALAKLKTVENPEAVTEGVLRPTYFWYGWN